MPPLAAAHPSRSPSFGGKGNSGGRLSNTQLRPPWHSAAGVGIFTTAERSCLGFNLSLIHSRAEVTPQVTSGTTTAVVRTAATQVLRFFHPPPAAPSSDG